MFGPQIKTVDDRGEYRPQFDLSASGRGDIERGVFSVDELRDLRRAARRRSLFYRLHLAVAIPSVLLMIPVMVYVLRRGSVDWFHVVFMLVPISVLAATWSLVRSGTPQGMKDALLAAGRCPSCAYRIDQLPIQNDGCTICPECAAAWVLRSGRPA
jgi:hypothetical protein